MPALFDKLGVKFQYPENWTLEVDHAVPDQIAVTVTSPGGAFWSVATHDLLADPLELADAVVAVMRQEYGEVETESVSETLAGADLVGYDMSFFYLDLISTARVRACRTEGALFVIHCQAEDGEFARLEPVFQAMSVSLMQGSAI